MKKPSYVKFLVDGYGEEQQFRVIHLHPVDEEIEAGGELAVLQVIVWTWWQWLENRLL